ncbi:MAG: helix-turn-helix domain-containing protein [Candidatus Omnitrophota bacterium]|nr:helix-turn-helix domain-containing protein [Candidatus Omnitrophota bacterium]
MDILDVKAVEINDSLYKDKHGVLYKYVLETIERPLFEQALERTYGNQLKAAKILGINRNTMRSKIKKLGIDPGRWKI